MMGGGEKGNLICLCFPQPAETRLASLRSFISKVSQNNCSYLYKVKKFAYVYMHECVYLCLNVSTGGGVENSPIQLVWLVV